MADDGGGTPPPKGLQQVADVMRMPESDGRAQQVWQCVQHLCLSASPEGLNHVAATEKETERAMKEEGGLPFGLASRFVSNACQRVRAPQAADPATSSATGGGASSAQGGPGKSGSSKGKRSHMASQVDPHKEVHDEVWREGEQGAKEQGYGWDAKFSTEAHGKKGGVVEGAIKRGQPRQLTPVGRELVGNIGRRLSLNPAWGAIKSQYPCLSSLVPGAQADEASWGAAWSLIEPLFKAAIHNFSETRKNSGGSEEQQRQREQRKQQQQQLREQQKHQREQQKQQEKQQQREEREKEKQLKQQQQQKQEREKAKQQPQQQQQQQQKRRLLRSQVQQDEPSSANEDSQLRNDLAMNDKHSGSEEDLPGDDAPAPKHHKGDASLLLSLLNGERASCNDDEEEALVAARNAYRRSATIQGTDESVDKALQQDLQGSRPSRSATSAVRACKDFLQLPDDKPSQPQRQPPPTLGGTSGRKRAPVPQETKPHQKSMKPSLS